MTNRREFLQTAAALSAAPLARRAAFAGAHQASSLAAVIVDSRYAAARAFGDSAEQMGAALRTIEGDITDLWQHELLARWNAEPIAVAGLTERPALFLLERLAWTHGLRVVFEAEHESDGQGAAIHRVTRSADPGLNLALQSAGRDWPDVLAAALIAGNAPVNNFHPTDAGLAAHLGETPKLYSWIIAPRSAA